MSAPKLGDDWWRLASLVDALLDAPPERRPALIEELSGGDPARRIELEGLLQECDREPAMLSRPAPDRFAALFDGEVSFPSALAERYRLTRELGHGGMATVYLARDVKHGRDVAVKVVHPALASALGADRFLREIEIVAQLHHPHIVPLYDSGAVDGTLYYVMPYETGLSLRQRLTRDGPLPPEDVVIILRDVCDALADAHAHGIVHRDIKPDNVLLSGRHAMVTDFGVATAADSSATGSTSPTGLLLGTPAYMAPEQISAGSRVDHRADIYAVGVLAYELLAGELPFRGDTPEALLSAHLTTVPVPIATRRPETPAPLADLVMRCLEKQPADRWQAANEMIQRLDTLAIARSGPSPADQRRWRVPALAVAFVALSAFAAFAWWRAERSSVSWPDRWSRARIERLTDFPGSEVDAAISRDGHSVAFLADRDSVFDAFVGRVGSGQWVNLTNGRLPELFNEDVGNVGFTADAANVWLRVAEIGSPATVSLVAANGGPIHPFLPTAVMAAWSPDGSRLAYHETTPGDPIYVATADGRNPQRIYVADPGIHNHHLSWSPDGRFLYFTHGVPPGEMDVWRVPSTGGGPERITSVNSRVAYPLLIDERTLLYTATADDGTGPWLYSMDVQDRVAVRLSTGVEHYLSIAASADAPGQPRRLVATVSNPTVDLWSVPIGDSVSDEQVTVRVEVPTARSAAPRFGPDSSLFYLASLGGADGVWRISGGRATEIWKPRQGAVVGAVAVSPDGGRVCFPVRRQGRSTLHCTTSGGTEVRAIAESLDVRGAASWSPDGRWIAVGAVAAAGVRVFKIPIDGGQAVRLVDSVSSNPVWSSDGKFILYSGTPRARSVSLKAVRPDGTAYPFPSVLVDRVGDSYRFIPGRSELVIKLGGFRRQDFWLFDVTTGQRRRLTRLRPGESLQRFDVAPDGKRLIFERERENSDVVLFELPQR